MIAGTGILRSDTMTTLHPGARFLPRAACPDLLPLDTAQIEVPYAERTTRVDPSASRLLALLNACRMLGAGPVGLVVFRETQNPKPVEVAPAETPGPVLLLELAEGPPTPHGDSLQTLQYLANRHLEVAADPNQATTLLAFDVAEQLRGQGLNASLVAVLDQEHMAGYIGQWISKQIAPSLYMGAVAWNGHVVCCANDKVYDPLVGVPVQRSDYCRRAFGRELAMEVVYDAQELARILDDRRAR
ncbi:MAG: hypothetical protein AB1758_00680 [Candidatus Eremiobacterota bacterium]